MASTSQFARAAMEVLPSRLLIACITLPTILILAYHLFFYDKRHKKLPPGPKGLPVIGNLKAFSDPDNFYKTAVEWTQKYGEIVHVKVGVSRFIFLNSPRVVKALMDKRGNIYSSRPHQPMVFDAYSNGKRYFFMPYGPLWRNVRKISHAALNLTASASYKPVQDYETKFTLYDLLHQKNDFGFFEAARRYSASVIFTITYGIRIDRPDDPIKMAVNNTVKNFIVMSEPGRWLVDSFPFLAHLPSWMVQDWWKKGQRGHTRDSKIYVDLYRSLVQKVKEGTAPDCFVKDLYMADPEKNGVDEETAAYTAGSMLEAGSQSTSDVFIVLLLGCLLFPETVKAAHEELDKVVGTTRMPTFDDEENLPYIRAMIKEVLRWKPILKLGAPHSTTQDDWFEGYFIPKGATVMLSWWAIQHDPDRWSDPDKFNPLRYLNDPLSSAESLNSSDPEARDHFAYGAGRRVCPGIHLAQNSLFLLVARTLWACDITKSKGVEGRPIEPKIQSEPGFQWTPMPFPCHLAPRSENHANIVEQEWFAAKKEGLSWSRNTRTLKF